MAGDRPVDRPSRVVQFEVIRALHVLASHEAVSGDARARYRRARDEQWAFVHNHLLDARYGGVRELPDEGSRRWRPRVSRWLPRGAADGPAKTHGWKDPIHKTSAFLLLGWAA